MEPRAMEGIKQTFKMLTGGIKPQGPTPAEQAAQLDAQNKAALQRAEADKLAELSVGVASRRKQLGYMKPTLGG
jgi:hypothetical protein